MGWVVPRWEAKASHVLVLSCLLRSVSKVIVAGREYTYIALRRLNEFSSCIARSRPGVSPLAEITILCLAFPRPRKHLPRLLRGEVIAQLLELACRRDSSFAYLGKHLCFIGLRRHERSHQVR